MASIFDLFNFQSPNRVLRPEDDMAQAVHQSLVEANDEFGALSRALSEHQPVLWSDSYLSHLGVAANLRARHAEQAEAEGYDRMTRKDQLPLPAALGPRHRR